MESDAERITFADNLYQITEQLTSTDTEQLKFLCLDYIPSGSLEKMDITDFIQSLCERRIISAQNVDFLTECLLLIGRVDVAYQLGCEQNYIERLSNNLERYNSTAGLNSFKILLFYLADNITKEEVKKIILYLDGKFLFSKGKMVTCHTGFDLITFLIKAHFAHPSKLNNLIELAQRLKRMDLVEKIKTYSDFSKHDAAMPKYPTYIKQESSEIKKDIKQESIDKEDIKQESIDSKNVSLHWQKLVEDIPPQKHYNFCESLGISGKKYKMFKDNPAKLLCNSFEQNLFSLSDLEKAYQKLNLKTPLSLGELQITPSELDNHLEKYLMTAQPRGICLIINNEKFTVEKLKTRTGSSVDRDALMNVFESFHFEIILAEDLTTPDMVNKLEEVASKDHRKYDCFVCCILTHGKEGHVFGVDGESLPYKKLTLPFKPNNCSGLTGKPKLFFIQACQGTIYQIGSEDTESDSVQFPLIPNEADFLMAYATVHGYVSFRSVSKGSWFIQNLCKVFSKNAKRLDLSDMLLMVNNCVSKQEGNIKESIAKQVPAPLSTLRKKVYFLNNSD